MVKKRAGEQPVWSISPLRLAFSCGKNGISLLKEISFLPQRREFLAAKESPGVWKAGKNGASGGFFFLFGGCPRAKSACLFASLPSRPADAGAVSVRTAFRGGRQSVAETGFPLSSCTSSGSRGSRISVRTRPRARPRDSRGGGFDVLTKWSIVHSKCPEGDDVCISALNVVFHDVAFPGVSYLFLPFLPSSYFKHLSVYFKV